MRDSKGRFIKGHEIPKEWRKSWSEKNTKYRHTEKAKMQISNSLIGNKRNWNGGWKINAKGYKQILIGKNEYALQHRMIWCQESDWGFIPQGFVVHHRNGNKLDNRIENLACIPNSIHAQLHNAIRRGD